MGIEDIDQLMPDAQSDEDEYECCVCGTKEDLRVVPLMTGVKFREKPNYPVCIDCYTIWYETGETTKEGILKHKKPKE